MTKNYKNSLHHILKSYRRLLNYKKFLSACAVFQHNADLIDKPC